MSDKVKFDVLKKWGNKISFIVIDERQFYGEAEQKAYLEALMRIVKTPIVKVSQDFFDEYQNNLTDEGRLAWYEGNKVEHVAFDSEGLLKRRTLTAKDIYK